MFTDIFIGVQKQHFLLLGIYSLRQHVTCSGCRFLGWWVWPRLSSTLYLTPAFLSECLSVFFSIPSMFPVRTPGPVRGEGGGCGMGKSSSISARALPKIPHCSTPQGDMHLGQEGAVIRAPIESPLSLPRPPSTGKVKLL